MVYYGDSPSMPPFHRQYPHRRMRGREYVGPNANYFRIRLHLLLKHTRTGLSGENGGSLYRWKLSFTPMHIDQTHPTLLKVYRGHHSLTNNRSVIELARKDRWIYAVIETEPFVPHPIYLHGHDFAVMIQRIGT